MNYSTSKLFGVTNKKYLSELLSIDINELKNIEEFYNTSPFTKIIKGKERTLYNPPFKYKKVLNKINIYLQQITPPSFVFGGIKGRSYVMNATLHKDHSNFLLLDLKDFFPSTRDFYVYNFFKNKLRMATDIAKICTLLTTVKLGLNTQERNLPQGFATSPYLSFLCYYDMYNSIYKISNHKQIVFSCYYDDLTFSSSSYISKGFKRNIVKVIKEYGLVVNDKKTRLLFNKHGIKITGAIVKDNSLLSPNNTQLKMYSHFEKLMVLYSTDPTKQQEILELCNKVNGLLIALKIVETNRDLGYIKNKVKEIRKTING
ncbi:reverse transcriptase family protein [Bacillus atrophaeus]|uniref:reverse transcriptase family protein n=1 Tax=Bacillus atrophaeus TaxID=1452 RepID=UPI000B455F1B|nr:reverse transcriptase family protein [Bacillus atrophaeus]ARW05754.1 hypothetical protein S101359_00726 [Bacillus atrophaeus]